jgi:hypothetical protein
MRSKASYLTLRGGEDLADYDLGFAYHLFDSHRHVLFGVKLFEGFDVLGTGIEHHEFDPWHAYSFSVFDFSLGSARNRMT